MSTFDSPSSTYDRGMLPLERLIFRRLRRRIFPRLGGDVLELGVGTGVNLPLYGSGARVTGCDANGEMLAWAARRDMRATAALVQADAQRLPFVDGSFDVVAASLVFCSVADPARALAEARRVLHRPAPACPERGRRAPRRATGAAGAHPGQRPGGLADGHPASVVGHLEPRVPPEPGDGPERGSGGVPGAASGAPRAGDRAGD
jgi:SAM-dependent methyltransferase